MIRSGAFFKDRKHYYTAEIDPSEYKIIKIEKSTTTSYSAATETVDTDSIYVFRVRIHLITSIQGFGKLRPRQHVQRVRISNAILVTVVIIAAVDLYRKHTYTAEIDPSEYKIIKIEKSTSSNPSDNVHTGFWQAPSPSACPACPYK